MKKLAWFSVVLFATIICLTLNPKPTQAAQNSAIFQVQSGNDDVNQDGTTLTSAGSTLWIGNSSSTSSGYTGLRFTNVILPRGATIISAQVMVYSSQNQWISLSVQIAADLSTNSVAFSSTTLPSQRTLTIARVNSSTNTNWAANTWQSLPDISTVIQEVVNQTGWQSGNNLSVVIKGTGSAYARKFVRSYEGATTNAAELLVTYQTGAISTITSTPPASLTATQTPLPTLTLTPSITITPTQTLLSTVTSTLTSATMTFTPTASNGPNLSSFTVNTGWADVIPHQVIRAVDDRLFFFGSAGDGSSILNVYWTAAPGLPDLTSDFSGATSLVYPASIISVSPAYDGANTVHLIINSTDGILKDIPFNLSTDSFKTPKILDTGLTTANTDVGTSGVSAAFDLGGTLDIAYWSNNNHILYRNYQYVPGSDTLILISGPTQVDSAGNANHPNLAVSPSDNTMTIAWVSQASSPSAILTRTYASGVWGAIQTASTAPVWTSPNSGINIDQGPSMAIDTAGIKYLAYIEDFRINSPYDYGRVHYVVNRGTGWNDTYAGFYTHDPAIALDNAGNLYIVGHGYPLNPTPCDLEIKMCLYAKSASGAWTGYLVASPTGSNTFDTSPSTKWSAVGYNRPDTVEFVFAEAINGSYYNTRIHYGRINPSSQSTTQTPTPTSSLPPSATLSPTVTQSVTSTPSLLPATSTPTLTFTPLPSPTPSPTDTFTPTLTFTPLPSPTPSPTDTFTPTLTNTPLPSVTPSPTDTFTPTLTFTPLATATPSPTNTFTPTQAPDTDTPTLTFTPLPSVTPTPTDTSTSEVLAASSTPTLTYTPLPSQTMSPTYTFTPIPAPDTDTPTLTFTSLPSVTPSPMETFTPTPAPDTDTPTLTFTSLPIVTPSPMETFTPTPAPDTDTLTLTYTPLPSATPSPMDTSTPTQAPDTDTPTLTYTPLPSATPSPVDTYTPTQAPATDTPTLTFTPLPSVTPSPTDTYTPTQAPATDTPTQTFTPLPSATFSPTVSLTPTLTFTPLPSPTLSPTVSLTPTLTATKIATLTSTPTQISPSATAPPVLTFQVNTSGDDVNQDGTALVTNGATVWIGNGASTTSSYTAFRFNQVTLPPGARVKTALLQLYSSQKQWISLNININGDLSSNSVPFTTSSLPSQRSHTAFSVSSSDNINWNANTWYALSDLSTVVQEIINQSSWQNGNSLSIIIKGLGSAYARKYTTSDDGSPAFAAKLIITYQ